jgi:hypothetical protein
MLKKLYFLFVLSIINIPCFSQINSYNEKQSLNNISVSKSNKSIRIPTTIDSLSSTNENKVEIKKLEKLGFPTNQKISPEIFYVIDDKPVSREEYLRLRKNK